MGAISLCAGHQAVVRGRSLGPRVSAGVVCSVKRGLELCAGGQGCPSEKGHFPAPVHLQTCWQDHLWRGRS